MLSSSILAVDDDVVGRRAGGGCDGGRMIDGSILAAAAADDDDDDEEGGKLPTGVVVGRSSLGREQLGGIPADVGGEYVGRNDEDGSVGLDHTLEGSIVVADDDRQVEVVVV